MPDTPATLRWALRLLGMETLGLVAIVAFLLYEDVTAPAGTLRGPLAVTLYAALMAGLLALLTWALWRRHGWARGPAIVLQLLLLPIGYYMISAGLAWLGLPVLLVGLAGAGTLIAPTTRAALGVR